ncbi:MAG: NUDIX domain-containing protein [Bacilli bacterium]|nr:NUDIX domain-containing protein [Bacilli bacterium]
MELLEVLNSNGYATGEILDKVIIHNEGLYHKEVAIFLINDNKEILLQKRSSTKNIHPNKWAWHGGHVIAGESNIDAIIRESKEELGINLSPKDLHKLIELKKDTLPNRQFTYAYYAFCNLNEKDFNIQQEELSEVKWYSFNTFKQMVLNNHPDMMFRNNENTNKIISALEIILNE